MNNILLIRALRNPAAIADFDILDWDLLLRQARQSNLLPKLYYIVKSINHHSKLPDKIQDILVSAKKMADKHRQTVIWEIDRISEALKDIPVSVIYLKGAAYTLQNLPVSDGRLFSDIDILIDKKLINKVEHYLILNGWVSVKQSNYDQKYYRKWMHEIPPLKHRRRLIVVDIHHNILPPTAKFKTNIDLLIDSSMHVNELNNVRVFSPYGMLIHSMAHLFCEGEFNNGLRDLVDIDELIRLFSKEKGFWDELLDLANKQNLNIPLFYGLRYSRKILSTPVPEDVIRKISVSQLFRVNLVIMDRLFSRVFIPNHKSCIKHSVYLAKFFLYIRGHYLRMPLHLLIPHLMIKLFTVWNDKESH
ncbi:MAG: nucleotidyltransferase family protein [Gammaproteobacteria bacterium]|nr:nucleotidyltransferase family protein [Gammaproteobacteria bacterium]